jgi:hypothetical protein
MGERPHQRLDDVVHVHRLEGGAATVHPDDPPLAHQRAAHRGCAQVPQQSIRELRAAEGHHPVPLAHQPLHQP